MEGVLDGLQPTPFPFGQRMQNIGGSPSMTVRNHSSDALLCLEIGNDKGGLSYSIPAQVLIEGDPMGYCHRACVDGLESL